MSMASFLIAGIELLNIKDHYNPGTITPSFAYLIVAFILSIAIGLVLFITGVRRKTSKQTR